MKVRLINIVRAFTIACAAVGIQACVTSPSQMSFDDFERSVASGDALSAVRSAAASADGEFIPKIAESIRSNAVLQKAITQIDMVSCENTALLKQTAANIETLADSNIISGDESIQVAASVSGRFKSCANGTYPTVNDPYLLLTSYSSLEEKRGILRASAEAFKLPLTLPDYNSVRNYARQEGILTDLWPLLEKLSFSKVAIVEGLRPDNKSLGDKKFNESILRVWVKSIDDDKLLVADLIRAFTGTDWVEGSSVKANAIATLEVQQLAFDLDVRPTLTNTIVYDDSEVNFVTRLFDMPQRGATYEYEETTSGLVLSYAYSIVVKRGDKKVAEEILRGDETLEAVTCGGQRIRNAFGGTLQTSSYANSEMENRCTRNSAMPTRAQLRESTISKIAQRAAEMISPKGSNQADGVRVP